MVPVENSVGELKKLLSSEDPAERSAAVESFLNEELNDEAIELLCALVEDPDKGVRNSVDMTLTNSSNPHIPKYLVKYISSSSISTRNLAGEILLKIGTSAVEMMIEYMEGGSDDDKKFLIDIIGLIGDRKAAPYILDTLKQNKNDNVILACIEALGSLGYVEALDALLQFYELNELYKPTIIEALGRIGTKKALNFIASKFEEEDELTKFSMIESLGNIGDEESFYFLVSEITENMGPIVWPIVNSIYQLKERYNLDIPFDEKMKSAILQTIHSDNSDYRNAAIRLIPVFDDEEVILTCIKIYGSDPELDELVKSKILSHAQILLSALPDIIDQGDGFIKNLLELTKEFLEEFGVVLGKILSNIQIRNLADAFTKCLDNPGEEVRRLAVELLFMIDRNTALLFVDKMVEDDNLWNKLKLLELLSAVETPEADSALVRLSNDPEEMISEKAKSILLQRSTLQLETKPEKNNDAIS